jgi:hypothetical protein
MASSKPLPPPPTEPGEFVLSADGKSWELEAAAASPVCAAEQSTPSSQSTPGEI